MYLEHCDKDRNRNHNLEIGTDYHIQMLIQLPCDRGHGYSFVYLFSLTGLFLINVNIHVVNLRLCYFVFYVRLGTVYCKVTREFSRKLEEKNNHIGAKINLQDNKMLFFHQFFFLQFTPPLNSNIKLLSSKPCNIKTIYKYFFSVQLLQILNYNKLSLNIFD